MSESFEAEKREPTLEVSLSELLAAQDLQPIAELPVEHQGFALASAVTRQSFAQ